MKKSGARLHIAVLAKGERYVRGCALPPRPREAHKGEFGRVAVIGGAVGYTGAPVLAASGAVRTGSGLVHLYVPREIYPIVAVKCSSSMPAPLPDTVEQVLEALAPCDAVLLGPGLGRGERQTALVLELTRKLPCPLILDADGINAVAGHIDILKERRGLTILTPHEGEFLRLGGQLSLGRTAAARRFAVESHCVLVLKGRRTVTAFPDGAFFMNTTGNPGMAKGGSGDVLGGMVLSLLGQGLPPKQAVPAAVWFHGKAGDRAAKRWGEAGMTPSDIVNEIPFTLLLK